MNEINEKVSMWAKLHKRWEKVESDLRSVKTLPAREVGVNISAMEVELRALRAKVDTAFNEASGALRDKSAAKTRDDHRELL
ncbi:MAG TPA: hypothetical protein VGA59_03170 [Ramlibacter sp.]|jgi:hypothetical protein